jgi:hypothetical protein
MKGGFLSYSAKFNDSYDAYKAFITKCSLHILSNGTFGFVFTCNYMGRGNSPYISMHDGISKPVNTLVIKLGAISNNNNRHEWFNIETQESIYTITQTDFENEIETQDTLVNETLQYYSAICLTPVYSKIYEEHEEQELIELLEQTDDAYVKKIIEKIKITSKLESRLWKYTIIAMEYGDTMKPVEITLALHNNDKTQIYAALFLKVLELFLLGYIHTDLHLNNAMIKYDTQLQIYRVWLIDMARVFLIEKLDTINIRYNHQIIKFINNKSMAIYQKDGLSNLGYENCLHIIKGIYNDSFFNTSWRWRWCWRWSLCWITTYRNKDNMTLMSGNPELFDWMINEFTHDVYLEMIVCANKEMDRRAKLQSDIVIRHNNYKSKKSQIHMIRRDNIPIPLKKYSKHKKRPQLIRHK